MDTFKARYITSLQWAGWLAVVLIVWMVGLSDPADTIPTRADEVLPDTCQSVFTCTPNDPTR